MSSVWRTTRAAFDVELNPGPLALFVAGVAFEAGIVAAVGYRKLGLFWWLHRLSDWRNWFWAYENELSNRHWSFFRIQFLGFELTWEHKKTDRVTGDF